MKICGGFNTILTPFRRIEGHHSASSAVVAGAAPFGWGWLGRIRPHHQVPGLLLPESDALPTEPPGTPKADSKDNQSVGNTSLKAEMRLLFLSTEISLTYNIFHFRNNKAFPNCNTMIISHTVSFPFITKLFELNVLNVKINTKLCLCLFVHLSLHNYLLNKMFS